MLKGNDSLEDYYDEENTEAVKRKIVKQLKNDGLSDFKLSLILNVSEYQIKKLKKGL